MSKDALRAEAIRQLDEIIADHRLDLAACRKGYELGTIGPIDLQRVEQQLRDTLIVRRRAELAKF